VRMSWPAPARPGQPGQPGHPDGAPDRPDGIHADRGLAQESPSW
jgi:hypothetical protein